MSAQQEAIDRLVREMTKASGVHQLNTLNPARVRALAAIHHIGRPCSIDDLAAALGWTRQYAYVLADQLAEQGILTRDLGARKQYQGRPGDLYQCICTTNQEGN